MKAINEIKQIGNAYRICIDDSDPTDLKWARQSFWTASSDVEFEDGETLEEKIQELNTNIQEKFNEVFQFASNGKHLIASTLTGLGVNTPTDASYETMSNNIKILATNKYNEGYSAGYNVGYGDGYQISSFGNLKSGEKHYLNLFTNLNDSKYYNANNSWITCNPNLINQIYYIGITGWNIFNTSEPYGLPTVQIKRDSNGIYIDPNFEFAHKEGLDNSGIDAYVAFEGFFVYK